MLTWRIPSLPERTTSVALLGLTLALLVAGVIWLVMPAPPPILMPLTVQSIAMSYLPDESLLHEPQLGRLDGRTVYEVHFASEAFYLDARSGILVTRGLPRTLAPDCTWWCW